MRACLEGFSIDAELKKRLLLSFAKAGVQLNACTHRGKQGHFFGYGAQDYALFTLVRGLTPGSDLSLLAVYLDAGVNLNCSESSWSVEFRDDGEDDDEDRSHQTLLHAAIQTANADLVRLLVAHGADVNQNMVFSRGRRYYLMSCLQLAMEMKSADVIEVLRAARARERPAPARRGASGSFRAPAILRLFSFTRLAATAADCERSCERRWQILQSEPARASGPARIRSC